MANWLRRLMPKSTFARGVGVLVGGTAGAQALTVFAAPLLTRLYSPEDFGLLAVFTAVLALVAVIATGRYELAIPLPQSDQDAADLTVLGFGLVVVVTLVTSVVFALWPERIADVLNAPELAQYFWLIPCGVFFAGSYQVFSNWAIRGKLFPTIARTRIAQSIGTLGVQLGAHKFGVPALIGGYAAGQGLGATKLALSAFKRPELHKCTLVGIRQQASRYRKFPLYSTWTALFNTASLQLAPIMFVALYGATVAGLYALTLRIISMPGSLIGSSIGSVFLSSAPAARRNGTLKDLVEKLHARLAMVGALPLMILLFYGPQLFELVFGPDWRRAGVYAQWMAPWIYLQFQWSPISMLSTILELQREGLIAQLLTFVARFGFLVVVATLGIDPDLAICLFSIISSVSYLSILLWFATKAGASGVALLICDLKYLLGALILIGPTWLLFRSF